MRVWIKAVIATTDLNWTRIVFVGYLRTSGGSRQKWNIIINMNYTVILIGQSDHNLVNVLKNNLSSFGTTIIWPLFVICSCNSHEHRAERPGLPTLTTLIFHFPILFLHVPWSNFYPDALSSNKPRLNRWFMSLCVTCSTGILLFIIRRLLFHSLLTCSGMCFWSRPTGIGYISCVSCWTQLRDLVG